MLILSMVRRIQVLVPGLLVTQGLYSGFGDLEITSKTKERSCALENTEYM